MKECIGVDCEYFDCTSYTDVMTDRNVPYCKQQDKQLRVDYEKKKVYVDECEPSVKVINLNCKSYGVTTGKRYN